VAAAGLEQIGGAQDQQRRGDVARLEGADGDHQAAEAAAQHGPHADPQRLVLPRARGAAVTDGVHDREDREQAGDDRYEDRGAHTDRRE
jgi:hypothetical protein